MKTKILLLMLVLATCVGLSSCSENKIAKDNIKQYIIDKYLNDAEIVEEAYSELYISRTTNEEELQTIFLESIENKSMGEIGYATSKNLTTSPSGIAIRLMTTGCSRSVIEDIIRNDADFNKANYEAKEYFMIAFFTIRKEYKTEKAPFGTGDILSGEILSKIATACTDPSWELCRQFCHVLVEGGFGVVRNS